jgi:hypothetical protein
MQYFKKKLLFSFSSQALKYRKLPLILKLRYDFFEEIKEG